MFRTCIPWALLALAWPVHAQSSLAPEPLTLAAALSLTAQANPQLASARHERQAIEGAVLQAGARPNPVLDMGFEDTRRDTRETTLTLSAPLELGGKRQRRIDAATRGLDAASADLQARHAEITAGVTIAFTELLAAQARVQLAKEAQDVAARVSTTVARRVQAGKVSPVEETRARVAEANVRLDTLKANAELAAARQTLAAFWGETRPRFDAAAGSLEVLPALPDWDTLVAKLAQSPALVRARAEIDRRQALLRLEQSRRLPDVTFTVGMKRSAELGRNQAVFGVSVPLPLFDRNAGNVLEALRRTDQAEDGLLATSTDTHKQLAQAWQALQTARAEAQALSGEILPGAQSAWEAAVKGFDFGKFAYVDVLDAQRTLIAAKVAWLVALADAHRAAAHLERLAGAPN
ncbi:TolC family protein [Massilia sp. S19_KUP03_FR1]|uniref:TolC family protein n=1 Tax=Massilia sp. S19_KUP03_FR1 TaxID=3025503 RepID=UPI002FCD7C4E